MPSCEWQLNTLMGGVTNPGLRSVYSVSKVKCANNIQHAKNCDYLLSQSVTLPSSTESISFFSPSSHPKKRFKV